MAGSRGDLISIREQASEASRRAKERHSRAKQELDTLKPARPVAELQALIAKARGTGCGVQQGTGQYVCPRAVPLEAELGRAKRRLELEGILASAETAMASTPAVKAADPGSTALTTYLGALGIKVSVDIVAQWLNLVPVLAMELGSALAVVLVTSVTPKTAIESASNPVRPALPPPTSERDRVAERILSHVRAHGSLSSSHRGLARLVGADRNTVGRAIGLLAECGLVAAQVTPAGTTLKLASAA
jgi:hypothetical protein